jgi:hypothetical protein
VGQQGSLPSRGSIIVPSAMYSSGVHPVHTHWVQTVKLSECEGVSDDYDDDDNLIDRIKYFDV